MSEALSGRVFRDPARRRYEDFAGGVTVTTRGRTIEEADLICFAGLVGNYYPLHIDAAAAGHTRFGQRLAHGSLILSIAIGLFELTGVFGDAAVAMLEMNDVRAVAPVHPGDTIRVKVKVQQSERQQSSRHGVLELAYSVRKNGDEEVMTFRQVVLVRREEAAEAPPRPA